MVEDFVEHIPGILEDTAEVADILKKITLRDMSNATTWETNLSQLKHSACSVVNNLVQ